MTTEVKTTVQFNELSGKVIIGRECPSEGVTHVPIEVTPEEVWLSVRFHRFFQAKMDLMEHPDQHSNVIKWLKREEERLSHLSTHDTYPRELIKW